PTMAALSINSVSSPAVRIRNANVIVPQHPRACTPWSRPGYGDRDLTATGRSPRRTYWAAHGPSTAYRKYRASLARGNASFFHALRRKEPDTYFRRAVLVGPQTKVWPWA